MTDSAINPAIKKLSALERRAAIAMGAHHGMANYVQRLWQKKRDCESELDTLSTARGLRPVSVNRQRYPGLVRGIQQDDGSRSPPRDEAAMKRFQQVQASVQALLVLHADAQQELARLQRESSEADTVARNLRKALQDELAASGVDL